MSVKKEFDNMLERVNFVLSNYPKTRNNDWRLVFRVFEAMGYKYLTSAEWVDIKIPLFEFERMPSYATIVRCRRKIQNDLGKFLPTSPNILIERRIREDHIKNYFGESSKTFEMWQTRKYNIR